MRDIIESIKECLVRFFDNLFSKQDREDDRFREWIMQLEKEREEKKELMRFLMDFVKPEVQEQVAQNRDLKPILPKNIPWNIRRAQLEKEDREKLKVVKPTSIEDLERELEVNADASQITEAI